MWVLSNGLTPMEASLARLSSLASLARLFSLLRFPHDSPLTKPPDTRLPMHAHI